MFESHLDNKGNATQLVVITRREQAKSACNALYGAKVEQKDVSKTASVKADTSKRS